MFNESTEWDKKNRLKIYEALYMISVRDFKGVCNDTEHSPNLVMSLCCCLIYQAADNLVSAIATFSAFELMTFPEFLSYTILMGCMALPRTDIKEKVMLSLV